MNTLKRVIKYFPLLLMLLSAMGLSAQDRTVNYHPCFLADSVDNKLGFIKRNAVHIFRDSFDCKEALLDSIAVRYIRTKEIRYLEVLSLIRQNPGAKVDGLFTDVVGLFIADNFIEFVDQLYQAKGRLLPLQNELIGAMNMIINGKPLKQKYIGRLNAEIERARTAQDKNLEIYLEKLKQKIEEEKYR